MNCPGPSISPSRSPRFSCSLFVDRRELRSHSIPARHIWAARTCSIFTKHSGKCRHRYEGVRNMDRTSRLPSQRNTKGIVYAASSTSSGMKDGAEALRFKSTFCTFSRNASAASRLSKRVARRCPSRSTWSARYSPPPSDLIRNRMAMLDANIPQTPIR